MANWLLILLILISCTAYQERKLLKESLNQNKPLTFKIQKQIKGPSLSIISLDLAVKNQLLVYATSLPDQRVWLLDLKQDKHLKSFDGHIGWVKGVAFSKDEKFFASATGNNIHLWDIESSRLRGILTGHSGLVDDIIILPDETTLASTSRDMTVKLWDLKQNKEIKTFTKGDDFVFAIAVSPNEDFLAIAEGKLIQIIKLKTFEKVATLKNHKQIITDLAFSPQGEKLASASFDGKVIIWNMSSFGQNKILNGHTKAVLSLSFYQRGRLLASSSEDKTIRIWDVAHSKEVSKIDLLHIANSIIFMPEELSLIAGLDNGQIFTWKGNFPTQ